MILVTGGTGIMGSELVRKLASLGNAMRVLTLPDDPFISRLEGLNIEIVYGDVSRIKDLGGICDGVDTVYHLAAVIVTNDDRQYQRINVGGTANLLHEAMKAGVKHFIYISSASVVYPRTTAYSRSKGDCERMVKKSGLNFTIIRPTLVYDKRGGQEYNMFLDYLRKFPIVPFIGNGNAVKRPVSVSAIINGLVALCKNTKAYGKTLNFSGDEAISIREFARLSLRLLGQRKLIVSIPVIMCHAIALCMRLCMKNPPLRWPVIAGITQDANLDPTEAKEIAGFAPEKVTEELPRCFPREE